MLTTGDIGIGIRDHLEGKEIQELGPTRDDPYAEESHTVNFIDVADPHNPLLYTSNGDVFKIIILKLENTPLIPR